MSANWGSVQKPLLFVCLLSFLPANFAFGQTPALVVAPVNNAERVTLSGNVHPLARAEFDRGAADSSLPMNRILLLLKRSDAQEAALQTYMEQQQDKSSPNYHAWLTPQQFGEQYGPADSDVQAVTQWLASQGFRIEKVYSGKTIIEFSGSAGQVQAAFGTSVHNYEVNQKMYVANANDPQIPAALAPVVAGIVSLNNFPRQSHLRMVGQAQKIAGKPGLQPLFTIQNPSSNFYAVGPADFATIYNSAGLIASGNNGTGQTIAVVGETNIDVADVQAFRQSFALPANFTSSNIFLNGEDPGITTTDEETEADLDVQWAGAVAPGATVDFVVSASTPASAGIDLSALYIIEYNFAGVMSESYGSCEPGLGSAGNAFYNSLWEQAAAQGITVILSAGDGGSAGCDDFNTATMATGGLAVSGLASTPYNVAMGGTDFNDVNTWSSYWSLTNNTTTGASALSYIPEIPWSQNCAQIGLTGCGSSAPQGSLNIVAGSGGASIEYTKPKWQMGVTGMPNDSHRDLPDVSLFASPGFNSSGYIVCAGTGVEAGPSSCTVAAGNYNFAIVGGTSAAAPAFAGIMALVNQYQSAHNGTARQGNANYTLYPLSKTSGASCTSSTTEAAGCIFNDVTTGSNTLPTGGPGVGTNSVPCKGGTLNCSSTVATQTGVLVEPTNLKIEAYTATAGYDLTTGLGSVNINNLATKWGSVNTVSTTTTLTLSPMTGITHGTAENVTVNVTVTPKSGTATGDVSLIATIPGPNGATTQGLDQFTLNSSGQIVNATTNSLPGGTSYQVYAHYAGDGTNAPSDSSPVTMTVAKEPSQTFIVIPSSISGNTSTVTYGSSYGIRMYVTNSAATANPVGAPIGSCDTINLLTCPTGNVTLTDNGAPAGTGAGGAGIYNLNSAGYTRYLTPNLTGGTHSLTAAYSGDNSYQGSKSATTNLTVTPAACSLTVQPTGPSAVESVPFSVAVTGNMQTVSGVAPTGTLTFLDGTTPLGSPITVTGNAGQGGEAPSFGLNPNNTTVTIPTAGTHTLVAQYSGDSNYAAASASAIVTVLHHVTPTISATPTTINYGATVTISGAVDTAVSSTNTALKPTGTVTVIGSAGGQITSTITTGSDASGNWEIQVTATVTPSNTESFTISYSGDSNYGSASTTSGLVTVNLPDFSMTSNPATLTLTAGQTGSFTVNVAASTNQNSTVNLVCSEGNLISVGCSISPASVNLANSGSVTATVTLTTIGPSSSGATSSVRKRKALVVPVEFRGGDGRRNMVLAAAMILTLLTILYGCRRRYRLSLGFAATCVMVVILGCGGGGSGGGGGGGGSGGGGSGPVATSVSITASATKVPAGSYVTLTATVDSTEPVTGTITFWEQNNDGALGPTVTLQNGTVSEQVWLSAVGTNQIYAQYSGDAHNQGSQSPNIDVVDTGSAWIQIQGTTGPLFHYTNLWLTIQ